MEKDTKEKKEQENKIEESATLENPSVNSRAGVQNNYCRKCKTVMKDGVCSICGFRAYQPMDEKKRQRIRLIVTVIAFVIFIVLFVIKEVQG